jgi:cytochrome b561
MNLHRIRIRLASWAGFWGAALLWAVNLEAGQILPGFDCTRQFRISALISAGFTVLALLTAVVSWRLARTSPTGFGSPQTLRFDARMSALGALIFAFALALQTMASLVLTGCER